MVVSFPLYGQADSDSIVSLINKSRESKGIGKLHLCSRLNESIRKSNLSSFKKEMNGVIEVPVDRNALADAHVYDATIKEFYIKSSNGKKEILPDFINLNASLKSALADKEFNEIGYYVSSDSENSTNIIMILGINVKVISFIEVTAWNILIKRPTISASPSIGAETSIV